MGVEAAFRKSVDLGHTIEVSDATLKDWSSERLDQVATDFLYYFPFGEMNFRAASKLQGRLTLYRKVCIDVAQLTEKPILEIDSVQKFLGYGGFFRGVHVPDVLQKLKVGAALALDNVYSFPERYPLVAQPANGSLTEQEEVNADALMGYLDGGEPINGLAFSRFLRKKIAYFELGEERPKPVTWFQAVVNWERSGGAPPSTYLAMVRALPYGLIYPCFFTQGRKTGISFREFIFEKTLANYEKMLGATLPEEIRGQLKGKLESEQTRRDMAFYSAYPDQLDRGEPTGTADACKYLTMAKNFRKLRAKYEFASVYHPLLLKWLFGWRMSKETTEKLRTDQGEEGKLSLDVHLGSIQEFSPWLIDAEVFSKSAMSILFAVVEWEHATIVKRVHNITSCCSWKYYEWDSIEFPLFLEKKWDLKIPEGYGKELEGILDGLGARGKSTLFLAALWNPLEERLLREAVYTIKALGLREVSSEDVLAILLNYKNNACYLEVFFDEFASLSGAERLRFLRRKNDPFSAEEIAERRESIRAQERVLEDSGILQGDFGRFLVSCKLAANPDAGSELTQLIDAMKEVQAFVGLKIPKDLVAKLFFYNFPLEPFLEMFSVYKKQREILVRYFMIDGYSRFPLEAREQIDGALMQFISICLNKLNTVEATKVQENFNDLINHVQSGITCIFSEGITGVIEQGPMQGAGHRFVPVLRDESGELMACAGWRREGGSKFPIFDIHLIKPKTFRSSCASAKLLTELPEDFELFKYLRKLGDHHLAELGGAPEPEIPETYLALKPAIDNWILKLKSQFRLAYYEMSRDEPFNLGPKEGAFSLLPKEEGHFTFLKASNSPHVSSVDLVQEIALGLKPGSTLPVELSMHTLESSFTEAQVSWQHTSEGVQWTVEAKGFQVRVDYSKEWMATPEDKKRILNWQIAWLKALVYGQAGIS